MATFLSNVARAGLVEALRDAGLSDLDGASPDEIALALTDILCGPGSLILDAELRDATSALLEELCPGQQTQHTLEDALRNAALNLEGVVSKLFENYIMERFKTTLSEHLAKFGLNAADRIAQDARELVSTEMQLLQITRADLTSVHWSGPEGASIIDAILEKTVAVYIS